MRYWFGMQLPLQTLESVREEWGGLARFPPNYMHIPTLYGKKEKYLKMCIFGFLLRQFRMGNANPGTTPALPSQIVLGQTFELLEEPAGNTRAGLGQKCSL